MPFFGKLCPIRSHLFIFTTLQLVPSFVNLLDGFLNSARPIFPTSRFIGGFVSSEVVCCRGVVFLEE